MGAECMSYYVANLSATLRLSRSSWLAWQWTGPSRAISFLASWKDYWGASASLPRGRVILHLPVRAMAVHGLQLCMRQSPVLNKGMLRHQKLWGCLPAWTSVTRRPSSRHRGISYHQFSQTRSSSPRWLRLCLSVSGGVKGTSFGPSPRDPVRSTSTREQGAQTGGIEIRGTHPQYLTAHSASAGADQRGFQYRFRWD